jgi:hypothetical protein
MDIAQWLIVAITGAYTFVTYRLFQATTAQHESSIRPYINIQSSLMSGWGEIVLTISNTGRSAAHNLRLRMNKSYRPYQDNDYDLAKQLAFQELIPCFPPGSQLNFSLGSSFKKLDRDSDVMPAVFQISAEYEFQAKRYNETTTLDLTKYDGSSFKHDPLRELEGIREALKSMESRMRFRELHASMRRVGKREPKVRSASMFE